MATSLITAQAMPNAQLKCSMCQEVLTDPRMLPCGHTFCLKCLQNTVLEATGDQANVVNKVPCPQCRSEFAVGSQDLQDLPKNDALAQLISSLPANSQCALLGNDDQHGPAQHVCVDCWDALCNTCSSVHAKTKLTKDHTVKLLSDITADDIQTHTARQPVHCDAHKDQKVTLHCETCQRFVCSTCTGAMCKQHACIDFADADKAFITQINTALEPLQQLSCNFDCAIQGLLLATKQLLASNDTLNNEIDKLLSDAEMQLKTVFEKLLTTLKQCRETAKLTVSKSNSEQLNKLQVSLADKQTSAYNITQLASNVEQRLAAPSTVFDRATFVNTLPNILKQTTQFKTQMTTYLQPDISKWKSDVEAWLHNITGHLTTATASIPQLTDNSLVSHRLSANGRVTSAKRTRDFTVEQIRSGQYGVTVLSVSIIDGQLLVGQLKDRQLHVYSADGCHVTSIDLPDGDILSDAVWTPRGNIVYGACNNKRVVAMTRQGHIIQHINDFEPRRFSVSTDNVIYLTDYVRGVYQSTDDGVTWSLVFKSTGNWRCVHAVKVSSDSNTDVYWTANYTYLSFAIPKSRLRVCTVDKRQAGNNVTWHDVILPSNVTVNLPAKLAYDGHTNIFIKDFANKAVHVWSVSGHYEHKLVSELENKPQHIAVDSQRGHVMYVGQDNGTVSVFELTYESATHS